MRRTTWLVAMGAALAVVAGQAIAQASHENSQQQKMTACNADATAKALKGADRKTFMKGCLSDTGAPAAATANSQQEKMKTCNADATTKGLKGDARQTFMKHCLSASGSAH
jgi:psiF repeat-containing protein